MNSASQESNGINRKKTPVNVHWVGVDKFVDTTNADGSVTQKQILHHVSGVVHSGEVLALMGPSGSGKTTLLNVLGHRANANVKGDILVNGKSIDKNAKRLIAYVLQDDVFFMNLTIREQLMFTAYLRLPRTMSRGEKLGEVDRVIKQLNIEKAANTKIMFISGGEKKRTNICTEMLSGPSLLLLDEPTSGLDSTTAYSLIATLRSLSQSGTTVITSIHQPSSQVFYSFDRLLLLTDGHVVYSGSPAHCMRYMNTIGFVPPSDYNPADFVMDLAQATEEMMPPSVKHLYVNDDSNDDSSSSSSKVMNNIDESGGSSALVEPEQGQEQEQDQDHDHDRVRRSMALSSVNTCDDLTPTPMQIGPDATTNNSGPGAYKRMAGRMLPKEKLIKSWNNLRLERVVKRDLDKLAAKATTTSATAANNAAKAGARAEDIEADSTTAGGAIAAAGVDGVAAERKWESTYWEQLTVLMHRTLIDRREVIFGSPIQTVQSIGLGLVCGLIFFQMDLTERLLVDRKGCLFFIVLYWPFQVLFTGLYAFPMERAVVNKERQSGAYRLSAYFLAKMITAAPLNFLLPSLFYFIVYFMANLNLSATTFFGLWSVILLCVFTGEGFGHFLGAVCPDLKTGMTLALITMLACLLVGGFYIAPDDIPDWIGWLKYFSLFKYALDSAMLFEFGGNDGKAEGGGRVRCDGSERLLPFCSGVGEGDNVRVESEDVLDYLNVEGTLGFNMGMLLVLGIVFRTMAYLGLKYLSHNSGRA